MPDAALTEQQRREVLKKVSEVVTKHFYDPQLRGSDWDAVVEKHRGGIETAQSAEAFEKGVADLLAELKASHVGFYHHKLARATSKMAISATYASFPVDGAERWVFQDVHKGGAASAAGIQPGDILLSVNGRQFAPPEHPVFPMGETVVVGVLTSGLEEKSYTLDVPAPTRKRNQLPHAQPTLVIQRRLNHETGYIRITMYPGLVGVEIANEISTAISTLSPVKRLILDLRGNAGGGIGVLRAMSLLTPGQVAVGYSISRKQGKRLGSTMDQFPVFNRIPARKLGLLPLALKFIWRKKPIMVTTEGLGDQPFHKRVVLLVNRHTASANEMLVSFARENRLATIVGEATPGRLLSGSKFKLPYDYWIALPVGVYHTAAGAILEGTPIAPDIEAPFNPEEARRGKDTQLEKALEVVSEL